MFCKSRFQPMTLNIPKLRTKQITKHDECEMSTRWNGCGFLSCNLPTSVVGLDRAPFAWPRMLGS